MKPVKLDKIFTIFVGSKVVLNLYSLLNANLRAFNKNNNTLKLVEDYKNLQRKRWQSAKISDPLIPLVLE